MKKILIISMSLIMAVAALTACGDKKEPTNVNVVHVDATDLPEDMPEETIYNDSGAVVATGKDMFISEH